jgi:hypothetical protein
MPKRRSPGDGGLWKDHDRDLWIGSVEIPSTDGKRRQKRVASKNRNEAIRKLKELRKEVDAGHIAVTGRTTVEAATLDDVRRVIREELDARFGPEPS